MIRGIRPIENPWTEAGPAGPAQQGRSGIEAKPRRKAGARKRTRSRTRSRTSNASGARDERWFHTPPPRSRSPSSGSPSRSRCSRRPAAPTARAPSARRHAEARSRALADPGRARTRPRRDRGDRPAAPGLPRPSLAPQWHVAALCLRADRLRLRRRSEPHRSRADARLHAPLRSRGLRLDPPAWTWSPSSWTLRADLALVGSRASGRRVWAATSRDSGRAGSRISSTISRTSSPGRSISRGISGGGRAPRGARAQGAPGRIGAQPALPRDRAAQPGPRLPRHPQPRRAAAGRTSTRTGARCTAPSCATPCRIASRAASRAGATTRSSAATARTRGSTTARLRGPRSRPPLRAWWRAPATPASTAVVELRHAQGIRTRYAHLSAIGAGIRPGARVEQGTVIGRVGSSGLATGPHLHYEFIMNGRHRDPLTVELPGRPALATSRLAEFRRTRDQALPLLQGIPVPLDPSVALAERSARRRLHPRRGDPVAISRKSTRCGASCRRGSDAGRRCFR